MGGIKIVAAISALAWCAPAGADPMAQWQAHIAEASHRFGVPAAWIEGVMRAESGGRTHRAGRPITSRVGAMGLMQLMPGTWAAMRAAHGLGQDPFDPRDNILAGTAYLRAMYDQFGYPGALAAYNAGPARYARYAARKSALPPETVAYVQSITGSSMSRPPDATDRPAITRPGPAPLFSIDLRASSLPTDPAGISPTDKAALFAIRRQRTE